MKMTLCKWTEDEWDVLIQTIRRKKCILMLGPETAVEYVDGKPVLLSQLLARELTHDMEERYKEHIDPNNLMEVAQFSGQGTTKLQLKIRNFYSRKRSASPGSFHKNLAAVPFYLAILSTPDEMFETALKQYPKKPKIGWYNYQKKKSFMESLGTADDPLLFYLYGTITDEESLVATEDDLLDFLVSITAMDSLPHRLINELQEPDKSFLFLGFGFKNWYLRIILHILKIKEKKDPSFALEDFTPRDEAEFKSTVFFFQEGPCKIHFFEKGFEEFAAELRRRFEESSGTAPAESLIHEEKRPKVFICHASEDEAFATILYEQLKRADLDPWIDKENLEGGDRWDDVIEKAIKEDIDYFLILQSKALQKKVVGYVNKEIYEARERQKNFRGGIRFIIPLVIDEGERLEELEDLQSHLVHDAVHIAKLVEIILEDFKKRGQ